LLDFDKRNQTFEQGVRRRSFGLGLLRAPRRAGGSFFDDDPVEPEEVEQLEEPDATDRRLPRFSITRQGYDCQEVDEYVEDLERELSELDGELAKMRIHARAGNEVVAELQRVGEQTSSILVTAHEKAQETIRLAEVEASAKIADAASSAATMTDEAKRKVQQLEHETVSLREQHGRLVGEIQNLSTVLKSVAETAIERVSPGTDAPPAPPAPVPASAAPGPGTVDSQPDGEARSHEPVHADPAPESDEATAQHEQAE